MPVDPQDRRGAEGVHATNVAIRMAGPAPAGQLRSDANGRFGLKIGIVSDIHCDVVAFERALEEMGPVDLLMGAGDWVLQYRFPTTSTT